MNVCSMSFTTATASSSSFLCIYPLFLKKENKKCFLFFSCLGCNGGRHRGPNSYRLLGCIFIGYCCVCAARLHLCQRLYITEHSFFLCPYISLESSTCRSNLESLKLLEYKMQISSQYFLKKRLTSNTH